MSANVPTPSTPAPPRPRREPAKPTNQPSANRPPPPLTHHDIMALMPPFTRAGEALDLDRSDRARRILTFKPTQIEGSETHPPLIASLRLELPVFGRPRRLIRTLTVQDANTTATMTVEGKELETMLGHLRAMPPERQIVCRDDIMLTRSYQVSLDDDSPLPSLASANAVFDDLSLGITRERGGVVYPLTLVPMDARKLALPQDFFAVLDASWRPLKRAEGSGAWLGGVRPPLREPDRTRVLELRLDEAVAHCRHTFACDPREFHSTHRRARWRVVGQRLWPLCVSIAVAGGAVGLALALPKTPLWHMVMSQVPIVLICMISLFKEPPKLEVPPLPSPLPRSAWPHATP